MTEEAFVVNLIAHRSGETDTEPLVTHLLQQPSVASYEQIGWGPSAIDLRWRIHAPTSDEADSEARRSLQWLLGEEWTVELAGETKTLHSFQSDHEGSGRLAGWWNGLTSDEQKEALTLEHHAPLPEWMFGSLVAAGIPVGAAWWTQAGESPTGFLTPRVVAEFLDHRRHDESGD